MPDTKIRKTEKIAEILKVTPEAVKATRGPWWRRDS
jgi:hypothetical protein